VEDPNAIAKGLWQHFKPFFVILGVALAVFGPAWFFHGPAFWLVMFAWWAFLVLVAVVIARLLARPGKSGQGEKP
jgi:hypothetical protein